MKTGLYGNRKCVYIDTQPVFDGIMDGMLKSGRENGYKIGLDVETSMYSKIPKLYLIQVTTRSHNLIFDPLKIDISKFRLILSEPNILKIIHNASFEKKVFKGIGYQINNIYDTMMESRKLFKNEKSHSLKNVVYRELNLEISKKYQTSKWNRRPLLEGQLKYAYMDSEMIYLLHDKWVEGKEIL